MPHHTTLAPYLNMYFPDEPDFSTLDMEILRQIPLQQANGLFLTGDAAQKVYTKELNFPAAQLPPAQRTDRSIRKNYRNTREVLESASNLPKCFPPPQNLLEGNELLDPEYSTKRGPKPHVHTTDDQIRAAWQITAERIRLGYPPGSICIASCDISHHSLQQISRMAPNGIKCRILDKVFQVDFEQVVISDLASIKGFEFAVVLVVGLDRGRFPSSGMPESELWRDALRLYVAMTRARLEIHLFHGGLSSQFIAVLGDSVIHLPTRERTDLQGNIPPQAPIPQAQLNSSPPPPKFDLNGYRIVVIPPRVTQAGLASALGKPRLAVGLACMNAGAFLTGTSIIEPHIVRQVVKSFGAVPHFING